MLEPDFIIRIEGSIFFLTPETRRAESWCVDGLGAITKVKRTYSISSVSDLADIVNAISDAGFIVQDKRTLE
jgi:hypothetical protein